MASEVYCPECGRLMVERKAKKPPFRPFMGCPAFFPKSERNPNGYDASEGEKQCKGVSWSSGYKKQEIVKVPLPKIKGSKQQVAIWKEMEFGTEHLIVKALAGTGKTTTLVIGADKLKGSIKALAFNNKIAREMSSRMPSTVDVSTFHAYGWNVVRQMYGYKGTPNKWKSHNLIAKYTPEGTEEAEANNIKFSGAKLVALCKNRLVEPTSDNLAELCERYRIEVNGEADKIFEIVPKVLAESAASKSDFDYDDMIWIPIVRRMPLPTFANVLVDECQDLNPCRIEMAFRAAGSNGRIIAVGDENQAIYGFTGSDEAAMATFEARLAS